MIKRISPAVIAVLIGLLGLTAIVLAQIPGPGPGPGPADPGPMMAGGICPARVFAPPPPEAMQRMSQQLALTEDQHARMRELLLELHKKLQEIRQEGRPVHDLIEELRAEATDQSKARNLASTAMKQEEAILQAQIETWLEVEKILTPEQRPRFWDLLLRRPMAQPRPFPTPGAPPATE